MKLHAQLLLSASLAAALMAIGPVTFAADAPAPEMRSGIDRVADFSEFDLEVGFGKRIARREFEISAPDASFIKVHFDYFNLPKGMAVEVFNRDGSEVYRYGNEQRDAYTFDAKIGQNGINSFAAMSIHGDVAKLRIVGTPQERWTAAHGIRVSRILEGFPEELKPALAAEGLLAIGAGPKSICGVDNKQAAACFSSSDATAFDRARPVGKLILGSGGSCTAWRVGASNHLFTNNHCFTTTSEAQASEVWFNYQRATCASSTGATVTKVTGNTMLKTDATLDYTLFSVNNLASIASFGYLGLDISAPTTNQEIYIPQHPGGRMKEIATTVDGGARCKVDNANQTGNAAGTDAGYTCDTEQGSSGSPVVARSTNKAIALHHFGGCNNSGAKFSLIWPQVSSFFGGTVPNGDTGTPSNAAPTANFSVTTSGLVASFTDSSTDSDGTIASRSWNFGDGTTSTATNPSKTYAAAGTYNVTLTVTDNGGATNSKSSSVTVGTTNTVLQNGVAKTGLGAAIGTSLNFTMVVPSNSTGLKFVLAGGSGDADLFVKFGSAPTDTVYDCKSEGSTNAETCNMPTATPGTWYVRVKAYAAFSGASLTGSYTITGPRQTYSNTADYQIRDNTTVDSPITVSGRSGNAPTNASVSVNIVHTYQGDLKVDLVAPDGSLYNIHNRTGSGTDNVIKTVTLNLGTEALNGTWKLRVNDNGAGDTGYINQWSVTF